MCVGHYWTDPAGELQPVVLGGELDLVVSLFMLTGHGPPPGVEHHVAEIPDGPLTAAQIEAVQHAARITAQAAAGGRTVFVRCHSGCNRSGLVVAQALVELGRDAAAAIDPAQQRRSPSALDNATFREYLTAGLDVANPLVGLGS